MASDIVHWEYTTALLPEAQTHIVDMLNEYGGNFWELIAISSKSSTSQLRIAYFKRPKLLIPGG